MQPKLLASWGPAWLRLKAGKRVLKADKQALEAGKQVLGAGKQALGVDRQEAGWALEAGRLVAEQVPKVLMACSSEPHHLLALNRPFPFPFPFPFPSWDQAARSQAHPMVQ